MEDGGWRIAIAGGWLLRSDAVGGGRWHNHLSPDILKKAWTDEEDARIVELHAIHGSKWAEIAKQLQGRFVILFPPPPCPRLLTPLLLLLLLLIPPW